MGRLPRIVIPGLRETGCSILILTALRLAPRKRGPKVKSADRN